MPDDEILQNLRTARDALQRALQYTIDGGDLDDPEALERMLEAHSRFQDADHRLAFEEAKRAPLTRPKGRGCPPSA